MFTILISKKIVLGTRRNLTVRKVPGAFTTVTAVTESKIVILAQTKKTVRHLHELMNQIEKLSPVKQNKNKKHEY